MMRTKIITVVLIVARQAAKIFPLSNLPMASPMTRAVVAPKAALSVGVATPV